MTTESKLDYIARILTKIAESLEEINRRQRLQEEYGTNVNVKIEKE